MSATPRLEPQEDQRLVERCLGGDAAAWEALVRRHERLVYAVARSYRLSDSDLADVFQEVFAALVAGLGRLKEPRALVRWLASTTQRIARATALKRRREEALTGQSPAALDRVASAGPPVGAELERMEEQALLRLALASLSPRCRNLLTAMYFEEPVLPYAELARRLGVPMGSIGPTRARCFERLRAAFVELRSSAPGIKAPGATTFESGTGGPEDSRRGSHGEETCPWVVEDRA